MSEPLIPAKIDNPVTPSVPSISNSTLSASVESGAKECDATIDSSSSFADAPVKECLANNDSAVLRHAKEKNADALAHPKE